MSGWCKSGMRSIGAALALSTLVLGTTSAAAKRPPLLALVWKGSVVSLTRVDSMSLRPVGAPSLRIGYAFPVARSPRGLTLAFDTDRGAVLSFVDVRTLRLRGSVTLGDGWISAAAWPSSRRLVAVVGSEGQSRVFTIDPATRRRVSVHTLPLHDELLASATAGNRVVFLLGESQSIAPVSLGVAGVDGAVHSVVLSQITGGTAPPADYASGVARTAWPALAVDPGGSRAAVVGAGGLIAEVDLNTLAVSYHPGVARVPARAAKALEGWQRSALWLPSGTLAVTGMDYQATVKDGKEEMSGTPAGVTLVDTADWSSRVVDEGASYVDRVGNSLIAFGGAYSSGPVSPPGIGLRGYASDGALRFQLFGTEQIGDVQRAGGLAYVAGCNDRCFRIVDPTSGAMVGSAETAETTQLVGL
jgi:hypothetical protein